MKGKRGKGAKSWHPGVGLNSRDKPVTEKFPSLGKAVKVGGSAVKPRLDKKARGGKAGKWMSDLHIKKGAMTEAAEREGVSNSEYEQEHKGDSGKAGKRARLALAFKKAKH